MSEGCGAEGPAPRWRKFCLAFFFFSGQRCECVTGARGDSAELLEERGPESWESQVPVCQRRPSHLDTPPPLLFQTSSAPLGAQLNAASLGEKTQLTNCEIHLNPRSPPHHQMEQCPSESSRGRWMRVTVAVRSCSRLEDDIASETSSVARSRFAKH